MIWDTQAKAALAELLMDGKTAQQCGDHFGVSRSAITGLVFRDVTLGSIGFARPRKASRGRRIERTPEERAEWRKQYNKAWSANKRSSAKVIAFPKPFRQTEAEFEPQQPFLRVVSNNVTLMVQDWLEKNGGARRFEDNAMTDTITIRYWLEQRGYTIKQTKNSWTSTSGGKWAVSSGKGRPRICSWAEVIDIVDEFRRDEGLTPFSAAFQRSALDRRSSMGKD